MNRHLIPVKVGIEGCADKGVEKDSTPFCQPCLKGLHTKAVQGRRTVQQNRMIHHHLREQVQRSTVRFPEQLLCQDHAPCHTVEHHLTGDKGLEQPYCHLFRQTTLLEP